MVPRPNYMSSSLRVGQQGCVGGRAAGPHLRVQRGPEPWADPARYPPADQAPAHPQPGRFLGDPRASLWSGHQHDFPLWWVFTGRQGCYSETGIHIVMDLNFVCLWRRHNCNWSLPFCAYLLIYEINYLVLNNSNLHAIIYRYIFNNLFTMSQKNLFCWSTCKWKVYHFYGIGVRSCVTVWWKFPS